MRKIQLDELKRFCQASLEHEGMTEEHAKISADVLTETDAYGTHSHGTKNLFGYIKKAQVNALDLRASPAVIKEGPAFAIMDGCNGMGMVVSYMAMDLACEKAKNAGIGIVTTKNSTHFGAAGYYANMAAKQGMFGISMSNVDPNMTVPGAKGMLIGNNPISYAAPAKSSPSVFLDIAMSNVASLKVVQARKSGTSIPDTWIVDKDGLPTTDPSHYPEEGAMQPMAAHKGYGLAVMVELMTGALSGGGMSMLGDIVSWVFELEKPNNVCHTFIAIDVEQFVGIEAFKNRVEEMSEALRSAPKAKGMDKIYTPGEIEWEKYQKNVEILHLPGEVVDSLINLQKENQIEIHWMENEE
jgi:LDH2 family malate/lactate/ureidoglycolate dehydrogenase